MDTSRPIESPCRYDATASPRQNSTKSCPALRRSKMGPAMSINGWDVMRAVDARAPPDGSRFVGQSAATATSDFGGTGPPFLRTLSRIDGLLFSLANSLTNVLLRETGPVRRQGGKAPQPEEADGRSFLDNPPREQCQIPTDPLRAPNWCQDLRDYPR